MHFWRYDRQEYGWIDDTMRPLQRDLLPSAIDFAAAFPAARLVLDHLGKPDIRGGGFDAWRRELDRLAKLRHVRAKLSGLVTEADWQAWTVEDIHRYVNAALDSFGAER